MNLEKVQMTSGMLRSPTIKKLVLLASIYLALVDSSTNAFINWFKAAEAYSKGGRAHAAYLSDKVHITVYIYHGIMAFCLTV